MICPVALDESRAHPLSYQPSDTPVRLCAHEVTVHSPVTLDDGELEQALYGSFLPVPDASAFVRETVEPKIPPGHVWTLPGVVELNSGKETVLLEVTNTADRPIQVGSHYHFVECNPYLEFDREAAYGR